MIFCVTNVLIKKSTQIMDQLNRLTKIRTRIKKLDYSPTFGINEKVKALKLDGVEVAHLGFGESPFPVHPLISESLAQNADKNSYLPSAGLPELRQRVCEYFGQKLGINPGNFDVIIGPGSKGLIFDIQFAVDGDLICPVPSWVSYIPQANLTGDRVINIQTQLANHYQITGDVLESCVIEARRRGENPAKLILNYPNNPTGLTIPPEELEQIAQVCREHRILVISDEIYGMINFRRSHASIARYYPEGTIITTGLSKHLSLGGYRLGIALIPFDLKHVFTAVSRIASETWSTVASPIQYSVVKAFEQDPEIEDYIRRCTEIHRMVSGFLRSVLLRIGLPYPELDGAFYLYPDFSPYREELSILGAKTSQDLAVHLLNEVRIATLPGTAFGDSPDKLRLRLAACDYDGQAALDYYESNPDCTPESLVQQCCPEIWMAGQRLINYFQSIKARK